MGFIGELREEDMEYSSSYYSSYIISALLDFISDFIIWIFSLCNLMKVLDITPLPTPNPTRLSDQVIEDFVVDGSENCTVCLRKLQGGGGGEEMRLKKCKHGFHHGCIGRWTDYGHTRCPVCRTHYCDLDEEKKQDYCNNNNHWEAFDGFGSQAQG